MKTNGKYKATRAKSKKPAKPSGGQFEAGCDDESNQKPPIKAATQIELALPDKEKNDEIPLWIPGPREGKVAMIRNPAAAARWREIERKKRGEIPQEKR